MNLAGERARRFPDPTYAAEVLEPAFYSARDLLFEPLLACTMAHIVALCSRRASWPLRRPLSWGAGQGDPGRRNRRLRVRPFDRGPVLRGRIPPGRRGRERLGWLAGTRAVAERPRLGDGQDPAPGRAAADRRAPARSRRQGHRAGSRPSRDADGRRHPHPGGAADHAGPLSGVAGPLLRDADRMRRSAGRQPVPAGCLRLHDHPGADRPAPPGRPARLWRHRRERL